MHDIFSREPDPIENMLRPPPPPDNGALRQAVYTQTQQVLHRRRWLRQFAYAASLLLSFAAGAGVMRMMISDQRSEVSGERSVSTPRNSPPQGVDTPRSTLTDDSALDAEWTAFDSTDRRGALYRQAGDRYIKDESDLQSALRCYTNSLDSGTEQDLAISPNDNWLLMAIKDARQQEKNHANQGG